MQTEAACEEAAADYAQALQSKAELEAKLEMQRAGAEACSELAAQVGQYQIVIEINKL